jgi:hypothetical protein
MKKEYMWIMSLLFCLFLHSTIGAQETRPVIRWQKTLGGAGSDQLFDIKQTGDKGYIMGGYSYSNISGEKLANSKGGSDFWVIKQDSAGNLIWQKTIGGSMDDVMESISLCADGGFIISGTSFSGADGDKTDTSRDDPSMASYYGGDLWILKLDSTGDILWQKTYGGNYGEGRDQSFNRMTSFDSTYAYLSISHIEPTTDGGYIVGVSATSGISGDKTSPNRTEANSAFSFFYPGFSDYWILKLDASGNIEWQQTFGSEDNDRFSMVKQTSDGGYIVGGTAFSYFLTLFGFTTSGGDKTGAIRGGSDYWILKLNAAGAIQWQKTIGGSGDDFLMSLDLTTDNGYILGGYSNSGISGEKTDSSRGSYDYWVLKLNTTGDIVWQKTIGGNGTEILSGIRKTSDDGYLVSGTSSSTISGEKKDMGFGGASDFWVLKLNDTGNIIWQKTMGGTGSNIERMELPTAVSQTTDGGYIVGGFSDAPVSGNKTDSSRGDFDYWVLKLNQCMADTSVVSTSFCSLGSYTLPDSVVVVSAGTYYSILNNTEGCDSVVTTHLSEITITNTLTSHDGKLIAQSISGATYQWINCLTLQSITGAIDSAFQPQANGFYAAVITLNDCRDTTMCYNFSTATGILNIGTETGVDIYPNPATTSICIQTQAGLLLQRLSLIDITGRVILTSTISSQSNNKQWMDISNVNPGYYLLKIETNKNTFIDRVNILH